MKVAGSLRLAYLPPLPLDADTSSGEPPPWLATWLRPRVEVAVDVPVLGRIPATLTPYGMPPPAPEWLTWPVLTAALAVAGALVVGGLLAAVRWVGR